MKLSLLFLYVSAVFAMKRQASDEADRDYKPLRNIRPRLYAPPANNKTLDILCKANEIKAFDGWAEKQKGLLLHLIPILDEGNFEEEHFKKISSLMPVVGEYFSSVQADEEVKGLFLQAVARFLYEAPQPPSNEDYTELNNKTESFFTGEPWAHHIPANRWKNIKMIREVANSASDLIKNSGYSRFAMSRVLTLINTVHEYLAMEPSPELEAEIKNTILMYLLGSANIHQRFWERLCEFLTEEQQGIVRSQLQAMKAEEFGEYSFEQFLEAIKRQKIELAANILQFGRIGSEENGESAFKTCVQFSFSPELLGLILEKYQKIDVSMESNKYFNLAADLKCYGMCEIMLKDERFNPALNNNCILMHAAKTGNVPVINLLLNDKRVGNRVEARNLANTEKQTKALFAITFHNNPTTLNCTIDKAIKGGKFPLALSLCEQPEANRVAAIVALCKSGDSVSVMNAIRDALAMPETPHSDEYQSLLSILTHLPLIHGIKKHNTELVQNWLVGFAKENMDWLQWSIVATHQSMDARLLNLVIDYIIATDFPKADGLVGKIKAWAQELSTSMAEEDLKAVLMKRIRKALAPIVPHDAIVVDLTSLDRS